MHAGQTMSRVLRNPTAFRPSSLAPALREHVIYNVFMQYNIAYLYIYIYIDTSVYIIYYKCINARTRAYTYGVRHF